ncbi:MAG: 5'/3'-nucleotidase SurE, partial [Muribaculaceae bacterium]|nr:5'/3'-nucleotidase SurE [Muribaculaceae bacterium]
LCIRVSSMNADFSKTLPLVREITEKVIEKGLPRKICLNINFPAKTEIAGVKVVATAESHWTDEYREYTDPSGHKFYLVTGDLINDNPDDDGTDLYWLPRGYATIVPVTPDQTRADMIPRVRDILNV